MEDARFQGNRVALSKMIQTSKPASAKKTQMYITASVELVLLVP